MRHETLLLYARMRSEHLTLAFEAPRNPPATFTLGDWLQRFPQHDRTHGDDLRPAMKHATSRFA